MMGLSAEAEGTVLEMGGRPVVQVLPVPGERNGADASPAAADVPEIPEGIRRAKAALRRDLPELLAGRRTRGKWVCYHLETRIGISKDDMDLIRECNRRNIPHDEYTIEQITPDAGSVLEIEIETMSAPGKAAAGAGWAAAGGPSVPVSSGCQLRLPTQIAKLT